METALAALDSGVRALFSSAAPPAHSLCECSLLHPSPDWRFLRRFPVLQRYVLRQWRIIAADPPRRKRQKRALTALNDDEEAVRALGLAELIRALAQCGLVTSESETMRELVQSETLQVLRNVVLGTLPLKLRVLALGFVLQTREKQVQEVETQKWVQEVCEKLLEEALEAVVRVDTPRKESGCVFCRGVEQRVKDGAWGFLAMRARECARVLLDGGETETNKAVVALVAVQKSMTTESLDTNRPRRRSGVLVKVEDGAELSISVLEYEQIGQSVCGSPVCVELKQMRSLWMRVWKREFSRFDGVQQIALADAIRHCAKADAFATAVADGTKAKTGQLFGFRTVVKVVAVLSVDKCTIITLFARIWGASVNDMDSKSARHCFSWKGMESVPVKRVYQEYLHELLQSRCIWQQLGSTTPAMTAKTQEIELIYFLFKIFEGSKAQRVAYLEQWDTLLSHYGDGSEPTKDGINWCLALEKCVIGVEYMRATTSHQREIFLCALEKYCIAVMNGVLMTNGEMISSGGNVRRQLVVEDGDRLVVRRVLAQMMTTFDQDWVCSLIAIALRTQTRLHSLEKSNQRGVNTLLFPALVSSMKTSSRSHQKRGRSGQKQFLDVVSGVNAILKESEATPLYLTSLVRFCEAWDVYQCTHTKDPPSKVNRWGYRAMVGLNVLPELIRCYEVGDALRQENNDTLVFTAEVMQNASNCPPQLVENLYRVLSAITEYTKSALPALQSTEKPLVSHSNEILNRLLRAVSAVDLAQTRKLMEQLKSDVGTLHEFKGQLEQWLTSVDSNGAPAIGKESRIELSLLCTRLARWFPDEFNGLRFLLMSPLDTHLVFALKDFVKGIRGKESAGLVLGSSLPSSLSSAVRVEMALHMYLSTVLFPDLENLTVVLSKSILKCRTTEAFEHLTKVVHNNARLFLPEVAVSALKSTLRGMEFSIVAPHSEYQDDENDEEMEEHSKRAKIIVYQRNSLRLLEASSSILGSGLEWSSALFDEESAVCWLPYFFEFLLQTDFCDGALQTNQLLTTLEELTHDDKKSVLHEAFWVAALLNTSLVACSGRTRVLFDDKVYDKLKAITGKMLRVLRFPEFQRHAALTVSDDVHRPRGLLALFHRSQCARVTIGSEGVYRDSERTLNARDIDRLPVVWETGADEFMESAVQLFTPFSLWLEGALVYSQAFLDGFSPSTRQWERVFISYVTDVYLHLEFEEDACGLLKSWLSTWVSCNIIRAQTNRPLLALLPSQVALFRRLGMSPQRTSASPQDPSVWKLVLHCVHLALNCVTCSSAAPFDQAAELVVSTLTTLELVDLSAATDFARVTHTHEVDALFNELEKVVARVRREIRSAVQAFSLLQYPLELLVCCYACRLPADAEAESLRFLQRVHRVFQAASDDKPSDAKTSGLTSETIHSIEKSSPLSRGGSPELDEMLQYWADEMLLKYDYLDRERCTQVLQTTRAALLDAAGS